MKNTMKKKRIIKPSPIEIIESKWPGKKPKEILEAFKELRSILNKQIVSGEAMQNIPVKKVRKTSQKKTLPETYFSGEPFSMLDMLRQTCSSMDLLFLSKRITYHVSAASDMSSVFADPEKIQSVVTELLRRIVKRMPHGSMVNISLNEVSMRNGRGIEISLSGVDESESGKNLTTFLQELFGEGIGGSSSSLFACRESIISQGGQLSVDLPKPQQPVFKVVLPTVGTSSLAISEQRTFKYDISITNIANLRKRFGIKKSCVFVSQIENYVRALVRHPIDIVMSVPARGVITAIYDTSEGTANSVASRISKRLGTEEFRIGKKIVDVKFKYHLTSLPHAVLGKGK